MKILTLLVVVFGAAVVQADAMDNSDLLRFQASQDRHCGIALLDHLKLICGNCLNVKDNFKADVLYSCCAKTCSDDYIRKHYCCAEQ